MLDRMGLMPRWRNLNHFDNVLNVSFSDGRKFEDIFKVCALVRNGIYAHLSQFPGHFIRNAQCSL
jgi:hypothetical protein